MKALAASALALAVAVSAVPAGAQTSDSPAVTDVVVSAPVTMETRDDPETIAAAREAFQNLNESAREAKLLLNANSISIIAIPAPSVEEMNDVPPETEALLSSLRDSIGMNAVLTYAMDSQNAALGDVFGLDVSEENDVTIYVRQQS